jgi:predicted transposase/invertase (TIGR01784 family)
MKSKKTKNMGRYLDPKSDLIFKRIFGEHPDLLINFLNALMPFEPDRHIVEVEYLPPELVPDTPGKKDSIVDVRCRDNFKRHFIVEMQMYWTTAFYNRVVFNAGKAYVRQLKKRENFHLLQPVYTLAILNENFDSKSEQFYHHYQIVNRENTNEIIPGLEFVLIELQKFNPETITDRKLLVLWLRFLKEVDEDMRRLPLELQENEYINQAAELCEEAAFSEGELYAYDKYWDNVRVEKTLLSAAFEKGNTKGIEKGMKKGIEKGMKKGIEKGMKKGIEKGIEKGEAMGLKKAQIELKAKEETIIINSHKAGLPIETIATITGLMPEQIVEVLKQHKTLPIN